MDSWSVLDGVTFPLEDQVRCLWVILDPALFLDAMGMAVAHGLRCCVKPIISYLNQTYGLIQT